MPGTWWPLAVILAIFFVRYAVTVSLTVNRTLRAVPLFAAAASLVYGLASGYFLARALAVRRAAFR